MTLLALAMGCHGRKFFRPGRASKPRAPRTTAAVALPRDKGSTREPPHKHRFNVMLLTVDALRADLPWQGYARNNAPRLSEFASESVVYTNAYSVSSSTSKSLAALFTGRYPSALCRSGWFFAGYTEPERFLAPMLRDNEIVTIGWQVHPYLQRSKGLSDGYTVYKPIRVAQTRDGNPESTSPESAAVGIELLGKAENTTRQFFAWTHAMDPHEAYIKHPECPDFGNRDRDRYDSEVCFTDQWLGHLLDWARKQSWWDNTVVIVTSDHGEAFGEHGMAHHAFELWEPLVRVPLLIRVPGVAAKRIELRRSQIDLMPTILELMGQPERHGLSGKSLAPEVLGLAEPEEREPVVLDSPEDDVEQPRRAIIEGHYKLIAFGNQRVALYDIVNDPAESKDLVEHEPQRLMQMKQALKAVSAQIPAVEPYGGMKLASGRIANGPMVPAR
jgi:choline-sulfatase